MDASLSELYSFPQSGSLLLTDRPINTAGMWPSYERKEFIVSIIPKSSGENVGKLRS